MVTVLKKCVMHEVVSFLISYHILLSMNNFLLTVGRILNARFFDCELRGFAQDAIKIITGKKEYAMNNVTRDRLQTCTRYRYHACSIYLYACTCMYSCRSSRMSLLRFFKPTANLPICQHHSQSQAERNRRSSSMVFC